MKGRHSEIKLRNGIVIKKFHPEFRYNFWKELVFLNSLQPFFFVPRLIDHNSARLEIKMEFVRGQHIGEIIENIGANQIEKILNICRILDMLGIQKEEMNHPDRHIIIGKRIVFIDFERSVLKDRPSNLTQFVTYLNFKRKIICMDELIKMMKPYKMNFDEISYRNVRETILSRIE